MYILGKVLSILPLEAIIASLNRIVGPCVEELRALCTSVQEPDAQTKALLITRLRMLGTLCTALDMRVCSGEDSEAEETGVSAGRPAITVHQQPVLLIAQQLLPYLKGVVDRWGTDEQITEVQCKPYFFVPYGNGALNVRLFCLVNLFGREAHRDDTDGRILGFPTRVGVRHCAMSPPLPADSHAGCGQTCDPNVFQPVLWSDHTAAHTGLPF